MDCIKVSGEVNLPIIAQLFIIEFALDGLKLAIKEVNDAGGVNGKKITIVDADNKSEASEAVNAATKLISDDKVKVIVGPAVTASFLTSLTASLASSLFFWVCLEELGDVYVGTLVLTDGTDGEVTV